MTTQGALSGVVTQRQITPTQESVAKLQQKGLFLHISQDLQKVGRISARGIGRGKSTTPGFAYYPTLRLAGVVNYVQSRVTPGLLQGQPFFTYDGTVNPAMVPNVGQLNLLIAELNATAGIQRKASSTKKTVKAPEISDNNDASVIASIYYGLKAAAKANQVAVQLAPVRASTGGGRTQYTSVAEKLDTARLNYQANKPNLLDVSGYSRGNPVQSVVLRAVPATTPAFTTPGFQWIFVTSDDPDTAARFALFMTDQGAPANTQLVPIISRAKKTKKSNTAQQQPPAFRFPSPGLSLYPAQQ